MRKQAGLIATLLCVTACALAQTPASKVRVQVVLVDKDLNQKPVPKLAVTLRPLGAASNGGEITIKTGFDGRAEAEVPLGRYQVSTPQPVEFQGKRYSWDLEVAVSQPE
jgi:hypothetical protein